MQPSLFQVDAHGGLTADPPAQRHSETSVEAAKAIKPHVGQMHEELLRALRETAYDGLTDEQMQEVTGMPASTQRPRRVELVQKELVKDSKRKRTTRSGRKATVWVLTNLKGESNDA